MEEGSRRRMRVRRWVAGIAVGALALVAGVVAMSRGTDAEVCDATEYEGCPARWEYLWADADD